MGKKKIAAPPTHEELGAQYRAARDGVVACRKEQARAELDLSRLQRAGGDAPSVTEARERVAKAHRDVRWCQAVSIAAAEAFKGCRFDQVPDRRPVVDAALFDAREAQR